MEGFCMWGELRKMTELKRAHVSLRLINYLSSYCFTFLKGIR